MAETPAAPANPTAVPEAPNWLYGILAGAGLALVAGIVYALVAVLADKEFVYLAILAGIGAGFGVRKFGNVATPLSGVISAVLGVAGWILGVYVAYAMSAAKAFDVSFGEAFRTFAGSSSFLGDYFSADFWGYLMLVATAGFGFVIGSGIRDK